MKLVNLGKTDEDIKVNETGLYNQIDLVFSRFVAWKLFGFKHSQLASIADGDSWYDTLHGVVEEFIVFNPDMWKLCGVDEDETCEQCKGEEPTAWVKVENKVVSLHDECQEEFLKDKPSASVVF
jgi:hypothetical protein